MYMSITLVTLSLSLYLCIPKVPNPAALSQDKLSQFEFVGKLMGLALRTRNLMWVTFPSVVWKPLVGASLTEDDIAAIDVLQMNILKNLDNENMDPVDFTNQMSDVKFTITGSDSKIHPLCPNGANISLTFENRHEYASLVKKFRFEEFRRPVAAIRRGLGKVVPLDALGVFTWRDLETMVCGRGFASEDVELLKRETTYKSGGPTDQHIIWFWDVLTNDFNDEERSLYLVFVWGRSRLPLTAAEFDTKHKISSREGGDRAFPLAHTCFNQLDLPAYSSREVLAQRLRTAIYMCGVIDGD